MLHLSNFKLSTNENHVLMTNGHSGKCYSVIKTRHRGMIGGLPSQTTNSQSKLEPVVFYHLYLPLRSGVN